jgi:hypothetical protein
VSYRRQVGENYVQASRASVRILYDIPQKYVVCFLFTLSDPNEKKRSVEHFEKQQKDKEKSILDITKTVKIEKMRDTLGTRRKKRQSSELSPTSRGELCAGVTGVCSYLI